MKNEKNDIAFDNSQNIPLSRFANEMFKMRRAGGLRLPCSVGGCVWEGHALPLSVPGPHSKTHQVTSECLSSF